MGEDAAPPRVLCEGCGELITFVGKYTGQPTTAVALVTGNGDFECGCEDTPGIWEIRHDRPVQQTSSDPAWMHPDGCRCEVCTDG